MSAMRGERVIVWPSAPSGFAVYSYGSHDSQPTLYANVYPILSIIYDPMRRATQPEHGDWLSYSSSGLYSPCGFGQNYMVRINPQAPCTFSHQWPAPKPRGKVEWKYGGWRSTAKANRGSEVIIDTPELPSVEWFEKAGF